MKKIYLIAIMLLVSSAAFAQKFAHINSQEVFQLMPEMDEVRTKMDAIIKENNDVLNAMIEEYQTKGQEYQKKATTGVWTPAVKESKEKELVDLEQRISDTQQSMQQEMQGIQSNLTAPVMTKFKDKLSEIAKAAGYIYVFDSGSALYIDPAQSYDLTKDVRKALNIPEGRTLETLQAELQAKAQQQAQ